jgi:hypothetical protein
MSMRIIYALLAVLVVTSPASAQEKAVVGLVPKAQKPIAMDKYGSGWRGWRPSRSAAAQDNDLEVVLG